MEGRPRLARSPPPPAAAGGFPQGPARFPAHQRPPVDPAVLERGRGVYVGSCGACHGVDARGGQLGGPNLLRSQLVLNDQDGELIAPVVKNGRPGTLMVPLADCRRRHQGHRRLSARPAGAGQQPGRPASGTTGRTQHPAGRRQGRREVLRRQVQHLPFRRGRSAGPGDPRARSQDAAEPVGVRRPRGRRPRRGGGRPPSAIERAHGDRDAALG